MDKIRIERSSDGYEEETIDIPTAVTKLNSDLENEMTIWIDGKPFMGDLITEDDLKSCKKEVCVTNKLVGG